MVVGVIYKAVVAKNNPFGVAPAATVVDVALIILSSLLFGQQTLKIAKFIAADAFPRSHLVQIALLTYPTKALCLLFGDIVFGQMTVGVDI